jgi:hypothetical protein
MVWKEFCSYLGKDDADGFSPWPAVGHTVRKDCRGDVGASPMKQ